MMMPRVLLLIIILLFTSCAKDHIEVIKEKEVKSATEMILTFQDRPQEKVQEYRWRTLNSYEDFIKANKGYKSDLMAKSMHQLADIYMEIEENTYMKRKGSFDHSRSRGLYEEILKLYPKRSENGGILYQLARGYMEEGELNKSNQMLERIIKEFPDGKYSQEAAFRLGEYYFSLNDKQKAVSYYRQALKGDDSSLYEKSLYKLGWSFFQSKDYEGAADMFMALLQRKGISLTPEGKEEIGEISIIERDMVWDSINTLVLVFDYMGDPSKIANYFKVRGVQEFEPYVYRKLGDIYLNTGRFKEAADVYEAFVNTNPLHEDAPVFQSKIIEAYTRGNMVDLAYNSRIKFVESYMEDSIWFKSNRRMAQKRIKDLVDYNKGLIKTDMYNLAKFHYSNARSSNKKDDYFEAILWIRRFIDIFPQEPESINLRYMLVEVNFIYAEIYSELKEYEKALAEYEKVAYKYQPSPFSAEAGYKILFYLEKLAKPSGKLRTDSDYPIRLADGGKNFVKAFPEDKRVPEVMLNSAEIFFQFDKFGESREMAEPVLIHTLSTDKERYTAQRIIAESYLKERVYNRSEEEIRKAISMIPEGSRKDLPLLERALGSSLYKQAEGLRAQGKKLEAAEAFERAYNTAPNSDIAPLALYDAGILFEEALQIHRAIRMYETLTIKYPDSRFAYDAVIQWGEISEEFKQFADAAKIYEKAVGITTDTEQQEKMLYRSFLMYEKANDSDGLNNNYRIYGEKFPKSPKMVELTFKLGKNKEAKNDISGAKELYEKVVLLNEKLKAGATLETSELAAKARLILSDYKKRSYEDIKLVNPLEKNLKKKEKLLKETLAGYTTAAKYRISDITTEATYKMGEMLEQFKDAILNSDRPAELTPEQLEEYNFLLEEQAFPFEEKAISTYESNIRKTINEGIYNQWVRISYDKLAQLLPARYKRNEIGERFSGDLTAAIADDPGLYNRRGIMFRENGEFKKAEEDYLKSIFLKPDFPEPYINLGILYELYLGKFTDALKNYKEYVKLTGNSKEITVWIDVLEKKRAKKSQN